jgi:cell division protein FtsB
MYNRQIIEETKRLNQQTIEMEQWLQNKNNRDSLEKFARENYWMKRNNEVIYIFD